MYTQETWKERWAESTPVLEALNDLLSALKSDTPPEPESITIAMGQAIEAHAMREGTDMTARILANVADDMLTGHPIWDGFPA